MKKFGTCSIFNGSSNVFLWTNPLQFFYIFLELPQNSQHSFDIYSLNITRQWWHNMLLSDLEYKYKLRLEISVLERISSFFSRIQSKPLQLTITSAKSIRSPIFSATFFAFLIFSHGLPKKLIKSSKFHWKSHHISSSYCFPCFKFVLQAFYSLVYFQTKFQASNSTKSCSFTYFHQ